MTELLRFLPDLLLVWSAFIIAVASPGPSNLMIIGTSMELGCRPGVILALGVVSGSITWGILSAIGVAAILAANATALLAINILGGLYLLYLAFRSARAALTPENAVQPRAIAAGRSAVQIYLRGYLMHLTNPKAILSWTAIIALGVRPETPVLIVLAILAGCFLISLSCNLGYAALFSTRRMVDGYRRVRRRAEGVLAVFFAFAGFKLLLSRF